MKQLLCLLLVSLLSVALKAQLNGTYTSSWGFGHTSLVFNKNGEFNYNSGGCTSHSKGNGKYEISGNKLRLIFQSYLNKEDSLIKIGTRNFTEAATDSINIKVNILNMGDTANTFLFHYKLLIKDSLGNEIMPNSKNTILGYYNFKLKKTNQQLTLLIAAKQTFKTLNIPSNKSTNITLYLNDGFNHLFYDGQVIEYTVGQINKEFMCLLKTGTKDYLKFHRETKRNKKNSKPYHEDYYCQ